MQFSHLFLPSLSHFLLKTCNVSRERERGESLFLSPFLTSKFLFKISFQNKIVTNENEESKGGMKMRNEGMKSLEEEKKQRVNEERGKG